MAADRAHLRRIEGVVPRNHLVNALRSSRATVAVVSGPPGAGKSTLLAQWFLTEPNGVWLTLGPEHNDPVGLWRSLIARVGDRAPDFGSECLALLDDRGAAAIDDMATLVCTELADRQLTIVLFLDDVEQVEDERSLGELHRLARTIPAGNRLALASRSQRPLPLARLRLEGELVEIGAADLALSYDEAAELFRLRGVTVSEEVLVALMASMEGWAQGLAFVAESGRAVPAALESVDATQQDREVVASLMAEQLMADLAPDDQRFLLETSILRRLSGELCNAVCSSADAHRRLAELDEANSLVVPIADSTTGWYRYHPLFAEALQTQLADRWPERVELLHKRAFDWLEQNDDLGEALHHAFAAGLRHEGRVALCEHWYAGFDSDQAWTLRRLFDRFELDDFVAHPPLLVAAAMAHSIFDDDPAYTRGLIAAIDPESLHGPTHDGTASLHTSLLFVKAGWALDGLEGALADAEAAYEQEPSDSRWRAVAAMFAGAVSRWIGDPTKADSFLSEAIELEPRSLTGALAMSHLALLRLEGGRVDEAGRLAAESVRLIEELLVGAQHAGLCFAHAVEALTLAVGGRWDEAESALDVAVRLASIRLGRARPAFLEGILTIAEAALELGAVDTAQQHAELAEEVLLLRPDMGTLSTRLERLRAPLEAASGWSDPSSSFAFTRREREVLELLATPLSIREIANELFVSRNTTKSHLRSIYRRLGVTSRKAAVAKARTAGLLA